MKDKKNRGAAHTIALLGMCCAASMILSYVESFISFGVPGMKVGLANIVTVFLLYRTNLRQTAAVSLLRVLLTAWLFGSVMSLAYSLSGAALSLAVMCLLKQCRLFSAIGVSVTGGIAHNAAQILVAALVMRTGEIAYYMPVLAISGTLAGIIIGIAGGLLLKRLADVPV